MFNAGFVAINNGGSAVRFELHTAEEPDGGAIVFHKPHPVPKIDPIRLSWMGRRMAKWFEWSRERFILKDEAKEDEKATEQKDFRDVKECKETNNEAKQAKGEKNS